MCPRNLSTLVQLTWSLEVINYSNLEQFVIIMKSANGKATGLDFISNRLLKIASPVISAHWTELFN